MKISNFGSLNVDYVYHVDHMVTVGETMSSHSMDVNPGGKGLNRSIALAKARCEVFHAGLVGNDGLFLKHLMEENGVDVRFVREIEGKSGHAIIQVDHHTGNNCILLHGGANQQITSQYIDEVLSYFEIRLPQSHWL